MDYPLVFEKATMQLTIFGMAFIGMRLALGALPYLVAPLGSPSLSPDERTNIALTWIDGWFLWLRWFGTRTVTLEYVFNDRFIGRFSITVRLRSIRERLS